MNIGMNLLEAQDVAIEAAREAGAILCEGLQAEKTISRKSSAVDLLTEYDQAAEKIVVDRLAAAFPQHRIIAEEGGANGLESESSEFTWYVDPLDGTNNYSHGFPVFAVSIALYQSNQPQVGVVFDPTRAECFHAVAGLGARLTTDGTSKSLRVSRTSNLVDSLLATGFPYDRHHSDLDNVEQARAFLKSALGIRRAGSAALDLAYVAAGRLDGYWEFKLSSWDIAAGILLVQEAGGRTSSITGDGIVLSDNIAMVASNSIIHDAMLETLRKVANS